MDGGLGWGGDNARAIGGLLALLVAAWAIGGFRRPPIVLILTGVALQFALCVALFATPWLREGLFALTAVVDALQRATQAGTSMVFGYVGGADAPFAVTGPGSTLSFAFQVLPLILVVSGLSAVLWRWRVLPIVTGAFAFLFRRTLGLSGAASFASAANIFMGMVEAPILVRPYLARMTRSELFVVMTVGLATVAGTVLVIYSLMLGSILEGAAGHLMVASLISVPAAIVIGRLMVPETETPDPGPVESAGPLYSSTFDALTTGIAEGMKLYLSILAMVIVFVAIVALLNGMLAAAPDVAGAPLSIERLFGWVLMPFLWAIGIPWGQESQVAGALFGVKTVLNEFLAYERLLAAHAAGGVSDRSALILTYALCGFANFGSLGIMTAGLLTMAPERKADILALGPLSMVSGTFATLMTGAVVAILPSALFGL